MKVFMPLYSIGAQGNFGLYRPWLGRKNAAFPYPIAVHLPVNLGPYYHFYGYYYQRRRTWHGRVWAAQKFIKANNPQTTRQQNWRKVFAAGVSIWHTMSTETKDIYEKWNFPIHMSGFNRFIHYYLREHR